MGDQCLDMGNEHVVVKSPGQQVRLANSCTGILGGCLETFLMQSRARARVIQGRFFCVFVL